MTTEYVALKKNMTVEQAFAYIRKHAVDKETIYKSIAKTGRLMVVTEENKRCAWSAEMASLAAEDMFAELKAPIVRIGALNTPMPFVRVLEEYVLPQVCDIVEGAKSICK